VGVAAAELELAVDPEGVVPDHPTPAGELQLALEDHLQLGGEVVADGEPEGPGGLERPDERPAPLARPVEVLVGGSLVLVDVVLVADVEGRIGEGQVYRPFGHCFHPRDAVLAMKDVRFHRAHCHQILSGPRGDPQRTAASDLRAYHAPFRTPL